MHIDCIVRKLMLINCKICFLLLDRSDMCETRILMYNHIIDYAKIYDIHYIKIYNNQNVNELLRDTVHTNVVGALYYSSKIYDYFIDNILNDNVSYSKMPDKNKYSNIDCLTINKHINKKIHLSGNFIILGIEQQIGPFSGIVEIIRNNSDKFKISLWDQWCHYTRDNIKIKIEQISEEMDINILQNTFDTSECKSDIDFENIQKYMYIYHIYYLGNIKVSNFD